MIEETLCPLCKSKMKPAKSRYGAYWRCTKWGCEGTRDSMGMSKEDKKLIGDDGINEVEFQLPRWDND